MIKVGDVVKLNSGSPDMTVTVLLDVQGGSRVQCDWFQNGQMMSAPFPSEALMMVEAFEQS